MDKAYGKNRSEKVALLAEGVDRNQHRKLVDLHGLLSPSSRRAWIEISPTGGTTPAARRRPPRGGRGLKYLGRRNGGVDRESPSSRRAWIEISLGGPAALTAAVALLAEGVDRNW